MFVYTYNVFVYEWSAINPNMIRWIMASFILFWLSQNSSDLSKCFSVLCLRIPIFALLYIKKPNLTCNQFWEAICGLTTLHAFFRVIQGFVWARGFPDWTVSRYLCHHSSDAGCQPTDPSGAHQCRGEQETHIQPLTHKLLSSWFAITVSHFTVLNLNMRNGYT